MTTKTETPENLEAQEPVEQAVNPRDAMMRTVLQDSVDNRNEQYIAEGLEPPESRNNPEAGMEVDEPAPEAIEPLDEIIPELVDKAPANVDTQVIERDGQSFIKVKVDGKEQEVPVGDMVTHYQKNENADTKLGQANHMLHQARLLQQSSASTPPDDSTEPVVDENAVNTVFTKLYDGEVDEAAKEMTQLFSKQQAPKADISAQVAHEVARISNHNNLVASWKNFKQNEVYSQIVNDPTLTRKMDDFTEVLQQDPAFMATGPSYEDIFNEAGNRTNAWLETLAPTKATPEIIETQRERKLNKPRAVQSQTLRRGPKEEAKAPTREDNIAKMAAARGQSVYDN